MLMKRKEKREGKDTWNVAAGPLSLVKKRQRMDKKRKRKPKIEEKEIRKEERKKKIYICICRVTKTTLN